MTNHCIIGNCLDILPTLEAGSVQCCVCSPPYWGLRSYLPNGHDDKQNEIGLESTPDAYVAKLVQVFREVKRVLRDDGTLWLNLGDSYNAYNGNAGPGSGFSRGAACDTERPHLESGHGLRTKALKPKDLVGIPWSVAFALRADGWYLRSDIIWSKPNPMPESVTDRPTKSHEYLFLLTKRERYFYDADAIAEPISAATLIRAGAGNFGSNRKDNGDAVNQCGLTPGRQDRYYGALSDDSSRNKRSVWTVTTKPYSEAHFATFPPDLIEPCILAGTSQKGCCAKCGAPWVRQVERTGMVIDRSERTHELGRTRSSGTMLEPPTSTTTGWQPSCTCNADTVPCVVLDPFGGSGTTGQVAEKLGRRWILIELNPAYEKLSRDRTAQMGMVLA